MYVIMVLDFSGQILKFTVSKLPRQENGRVQFMDEKTNVWKDFPSERVSIEEVK